MVKPALKPERPGLLTLQGRGTAPGVACGPLCRNRPDRDPSSVTGAVLVAERASPDDIGRILASAGTLTFGGALLSHVSLLSREFGKPSVSLGTGSRVRVIEPGAGTEILELADVVGGNTPPVLAEGDVVFLDGHRGTVRIPGGIDPALRAEIRGLHALLHDYAAVPDEAVRLRRLLEAIAAPLEGRIDYLIDAMLVARLLPHGPPVRRVIGELRTRGGGEIVDARLRELAETTLTRSRDRIRRAAEEVRAASDVGDLDRTLRRVEDDVAEARLLLEDTGADAKELGRRLDPVQREAATRRRALRQALRATIDEALRLADEPLRHRLGSLRTLTRRGRAAGVSETTVARLESRLRQQVAEMRARVGDALVLALGTAGPLERWRVGGKAAGLLEVRPVLPEGCVIPAGFVVTSSAYRLHLLGDTGDRLKSALLETDEAAVSRQARAAILSGPIPDAVEGEVREALTRLGGPRFAVRSSATLEDGPTGSLAGQFDTALGVSGAEEILHRIRRTWASLWNARALRSMAALGLSALEAAQAVLVQEMVATRTAGVLATRDPTGRSDTVLVNAAWGLGEGVSQGEVPGDLFWIRRSTGEIVATDPGGGVTRVVLDPAGAGTVEVPLGDRQRGRLSLSEEEIGRLAELARVLEEATGRAQEVEFGFTDEGALVLFQVRRLGTGPPR